MLKYSHGCKFRFYCLGTFATIAAGFGLAVDTQAVGDYRKGFISFSKHPLIIFSGGPGNLGQSTKFKSPNRFCTTSICSACTNGGMNAVRSPHYRGRRSGYQSSPAFQRFCAHFLKKIGNDCCYESSVDLY